ncbi:hypothetical protein B0A48_15909 [Cryoendolithus antarcticus]|uniref:FHA domain-containing protein n=1 Tax=Cryoendolithus antarcticus TaxID=1507870 RepID=A0A1V8SGB7_9PEZI|nr:hypothetical protein B0A48_15909 [Cryoendolithus antarcticus]
MEDSPTSSRLRRPSLLPAFEPLSSSPGGLPRPQKRKFDDILEARKSYPTPIPTSSTGILPSSPERPISARPTRPGLQRTFSTLSERAPLGDVPTLHIPSNGEPVLMGRSSNSSDYQLPGNRHISRVHVRASYTPPDPSNPAGKVEVICMGWNGATVHCRDRIVALSKGESFVSDKPNAQIIVDVQSTRVMLTWPKEAHEPHSSHSRSSWGIQSPDKRRKSVEHFASSPPPLLPRSHTPVSPSPAAVVESFTETFRADDVKSPVKVYEDHSSDDDAPHETSTPVPLVRSDETITSISNAVLELSRTSDSSENAELSEHDEENDPIVHSFGPFGENILSRFESFKHASPERKRKPLQGSANSPSQSMSAPRQPGSPIKNHVINQLAYARSHSLPLSTIHSNLPAELRGAMTKPSDAENQSILTASTLKSMLDVIPCVGEISREGKDAAGKLLESEFYYIPEMDLDEMRRETVTQSLGKTSIRAARKSHKQYYWKRPKN